MNRMINRWHIYKSGQINISKIIDAVRVLYCSILIYAEFLYGILHYNILSRGNPAYMYNIIPGRTIGEYITKIQYGQINTDTVLILLLKNIILFIPLRLSIGGYFKNDEKVSIIVLIVTFFGELIQMILKIGVFDIDDIILNITGYIMGLILYRLIKKRRQNE